MNTDTEEDIETSCQTMIQILFSFDIQSFTETMHLPCFAYSIQLVVKKSLKSTNNLKLRWNSELKCLKRIINIKLYDFHDAIDQMDENRSKT
ncbi:hypothetical protein BpHYR1_046504 [Brachionus plicatilis]|uniref:Uncharacterized protein n=1 Tax=Brachionus plicatilis TaxID=10195 RepID=A0A3M7QPT6_BRAPC|nr:hypothetical protein BpHYR1_046504 [Brachionus plicatilis]